MNDLGAKAFDAMREAFRSRLTHAGKVLTHRQLLTEVWGPNVVGETHFLRVHIAHLRDKIEENSDRPELIITEPGVGYRLLSL